MVHYPTAILLFFLLVITTGVVSEPFLQGTCRLSKTAQILECSNWNSLVDLRWNGLEPIKNSNQTMATSRLKLKTLTIKDSLLGTLPANAFGDWLEFEKIFLENVSIERWHRDAFVYHDNSIVTGLIYRNTRPSLDCPRFNTDTEYDLFQSLNSFVNLESLELCCNNANQSMPANAFSRQQNKLHTIRMRGDLQGNYQIGTNTFHHLNSIRLIIFDKMNIVAVQPDAINLNDNERQTKSQQSPQAITIIFNRCKFTNQLNSTSFSPSFISQNNSLPIDLYINPVNQVQIKTLDIFSEYLSQRTVPRLNTLHLSNLNCAEITPNLQYLWRQYSNYRKRIQLKCGNGLSLQYLAFAPSQFKSMGKNNRTSLSIDLIYSLLSLNNFDSEQYRLSDIQNHYRIDWFGKVAQIFENFSLVDSVGERDSSSSLENQQQSLKLLKIVDEIPFINFDVNNNMTNITNLKNQRKDNIEINFIKFTHNNQREIVKDVRLTSFNDDIVQLLNIESIPSTSNQLGLVTSWMSVQNESTSSSRSSSSNQFINSQIVSVNLLDIESHRRIHNTPIQIKFNNRLQRKFGDKVRCVYWNFDAERWDQTGCRYMTKESDVFVTVCRCDHLTNFAALLDITGREDNEELKSTLTYVFCSLSVCCLTISIVICYGMVNQEKYNFSNDQFGWKANKYLINLNIAFCLLVTNFLTIVGMDRKEAKELCLLLSLTLLFFLLSSFTFMLLQGYHLLKTTINPLLNDFGYGSYYMIGYGSPTAIILFSISIIWYIDGVFAEAFVGEFFCWISTKNNPLYILVIIIPISLAILTNLTFFVMITKNIIKRNRFISNLNKERLVPRQGNNNPRKQASTLILMIFNLGITWIIYILYIAEFTNYFAYVFIVLNGSQGIFFMINQILMLHSKRGFKIKRQISSFTLRMGSSSSVTK